MSSQYPYGQYERDQFISTTVEPLRDRDSDGTGPVRRQGTADDDDTESVLDRGRPASRMSHLSQSSFYGAYDAPGDAGQAGQGPSTSAAAPNGARPSSEWDAESRFDVGEPSGHRHQRKDSFFGLDDQRPDAGQANAEDADDQDDDARAARHHERRSSFYGIDEQIPGAQNYGLPPSHPVTTTQAPLASSRAASMYGFVGQNNDLPLPPPAPLMDHSHLKPGSLASLLSHEKTLALYRANAKKTNDPEIQFEFCTFVMSIVMESTAAQLAQSNSSNGTNSSGAPGNGVVGGEEKVEMKRIKDELISESVALLQKLANRGHATSQYFLADCFTQGIGTKNGRKDYDKAYPLFSLAARHGNADACFRAAQCCEYGWGTKKKPNEAVQQYRRSAVLGHPAAMHRLGVAELNGELNLSKRPKEGVKWLKRAAELADQVDPPQPQSLHELALLHEKGIENVVFKDDDYAAELLARASELQYAPSAYKLGECYEYGKMGCPQDAALSIHYYNIAAQQNHREACFALTAWYLVGSSGVLPQSDTEAYLWAKKAADMGLAKAQYAVGYFTEVGIGTFKDEREAMSWFRKAADQGDKRAIDRLRIASFGPQHASNPFEKRPQPPAKKPSQPNMRPPPQHGNAPPPPVPKQPNRIVKNQPTSSLRSLSVDRAATASKKSSNSSLRSHAYSQSGPYPPYPPSIQNGPYPSFPPSQNGTFVTNSASSLASGSNSSQRMPNGVGYGPPPPQPVVSQSQYMSSHYAMAPPDGHGHPMQQPPRPMQYQAPPPMPPIEHRRSVSQPQPEPVNREMLHSSLPPLPRGAAPSDPYSVYDRPFERFSKTSLASTGGGSKHEKLRSIQPNQVRPDGNGKLQRPQHHSGREQQPAGAERRGQDDKDCRIM